jgi:O-antigen ligase
LLRFPFFWPSLLFLIYILIQGLNPAWKQVFYEDSWWIEDLDFISWLPSGGQANYDPMNAFRVLSSFAAAFTLVWGLWVGIRRRQSALTVFWAFVVSGVAMALLAMVQSFLEVEKVLWSIKSANPTYWGSFFYGNHASAYLCMIMIGCGVLYFYYSGQSRRRGNSGGPHLLLFVFMALVYTSVCLALSRGGILLGSGYFICFLVCAVSQRVWGGFSIQSLVVSALIGLVLLGGAFGALRYIDVEGLKKEFSTFEATLENVDQDMRYKLTELTWDMSQDRLAYGWGAGSFRYVFPGYQSRDNTVFYGHQTRNGEWRGRKFFRYAHNDIVQFLSEYGIVGYSFLLLAFAYWIYGLFFRSSGNALCALMLCIGFVVVFGHAFIEFTFQSPAYWVGFNALCCITVKLLTLDDERRG